MPWVSNFKEKIYFECSYEIIVKSDAYKMYKILKSTSSKEFPRILNPYKSKKFQIEKINKEINENQRIVLYDFNEKKDKIIISCATMKLSIRKILEIHNIPKISRFKIVGNIVRIYFNKTNSQFSDFIAYLAKIKFKRSSCIISKFICEREGFSPLKIITLAGKADIASWKENNFYFICDYFNLHLETKIVNERKQLAEDIPKCYFIADVNARIGQLTLLLSKKCLKVYANEENYYAHLYAKKNFGANNSEKLANIELSNLETISFIHKTFLFHNIDHYIFSDFEKSLIQVQAMKFCKKPFILHLYAFCPYYIDLIEYLNEKFWVKIESTEIKKLGVTTKSKILIKITKKMNYKGA